MIMAKYMLLLGLLATVMVQSALASDPDLTTDFNVTNPNSDDFTSSAFQNIQSNLGSGMAKPTFALNFVGINGLAITPVFFEFGPQSQIDPHYHPRATELFFVLSGSLDVGFVDTNNELFEVTVNANGLFVFPKGMLHWQRNNGKSSASGYSVLNSENPGTLFVTEGLFTAGGTGIPNVVLATAFATNSAVIQNFQQPIASRFNVTLTNQTPPPYGP